MGLITKEMIGTAADRKVVYVEVPEWGGSVRLKEMSAADVMAFWAACRDKDGAIMSAAIQPNLLKRSIVDEQDVPMFNDDDVSVLMGKSAAVIGRLFAEAQKLNGLGSGAEDVKN